MSRGWLAGTLIAALSLVAVPGSVESKAATSPCVAEVGKRGPCANTVIFGHRCHHWLTDTEHTNENTIAALKYVAENSPGAGCEIDVWRTSDGVPIVEHDPTWKRTIDPATLVGVPARVADTTYAQVTELRTKGGEPIATLRDMIKASAEYDVPLLVETKDYDVPASWLDLAARKGATVSWYQTPTPAPDCNLGMLEQIAAAGGTVGMKGARSCDYLTPVEVRQRGTFLVTNLRVWPKAQLRTYRDAGLVLGPYLIDSEGFGRMIRRGARMLIVPDTKEAADWLGR